MKHIQLLLASSLVLSFCPSVHATDAPYILSQRVINETIPKERSVELIRRGAEMSAEQEAYHASLEEDLEALQNQYERINQKIQHLEDDSDESLYAAQSELNFILEGLFAEYWEDDETFHTLSEDEQIERLSNDPLYLEWVAYIQEIEGTLRNLEIERDTIEAEYEALLLKLDECDEQALNAEESYELNQCLMYPYSVPYLPVDQLLFQEKPADLSALMVELDTYLQKVVPKAYSDVKFDKLPHVFREVIEEGEGIESKFSFVLDETGVDLYSYAQELSLSDIRQLALYAYQKMSNQEDTEQIEEAYRLVLNIKEAQYQYIYAINWEVFDLIQQHLLNYLREYSLNEENHIAQVKALQDKYQIKFVLFMNGEWTAQDLSSSGFLPLYESIDIMESALESSPSYLRHMDTSEEEPPAPRTNDSLSNVKKQLNPESSFKKSTNSLARPPKQNKKKEEATSKKSEKEPANGKDKKLNLPDTGEMKRYTWLAVATLIPGISLCMNYFIRKYKEKKRIKNIPFD